MLRVINEEEFRNYALKSPYISIYQLPEWGTLKESNGWIRHLLGYFDNDSLVGVTMLLQKKVLGNLSLFYSPRGYLIDVNDFNLLKSFNNEIIKYIKNNKGFMLKVDPNVIYALRDSDGILKEKCGENVYFNFKKVGFKHMGFSNNFEDLQPRVLCRIKLKDNYNDTLNTFSKSTKKNIDKTYDMGVRVKIINTDNIDIFTKLLEDTASLKNFVIRPSSYYKKMVDLMNDYITLYLAYIDTEIYYNYVWNNLNGAKKNLSELESTMKKINIGDKIKRRHLELENKINKYSKLLDDAESLRKSNKEINIGALMSVFVGNEGTTFMSGTNNLYKEFNPKYGFYRQHIEDSIKKHLEYVNFYGISLDMDKNGPYYGIYELKKGFNPEIVELIGEFDYVINPFIYYMYKVALKGYKLMKRLKN